jgi:large subunit ribosomal protein L4
MASIKVVNLGGKEVGTFELDEIFAGEVNEALLWESVKHYRASLRQGTAATKNRKSGFGRRQEALEAEGHGPRSRGLDSYSSLAWRRYGPRTSAAQLRIPVSAQEADGRVAFGDCVEDQRRQADDRRELRCEEAKTKVFRTALNTLDAKKTALLVETSQQLSEKLYLGFAEPAGCGAGALVRGSSV